MSPPLDADVPDPTLAPKGKMERRRWFAIHRPDRQPPPLDVDFVAELERLDAEVGGAVADRPG